jgi:outer membrane protein TolC
MALIKFHRFSLQGYISKGLQNNLDIRIAMQNIVAAQATMKQERATFLVYLWERTDASNVKKQSV